jgi:predicted SprT family Zn-dependent metalloprotease
MARRQLLLFESADDTARKYLGSYRPRRPVRIVFTRNRSTILSVRDRDEHRVLRIQEAFREAPREVWDAVVALYLKGAPVADRRAFHAVVNAFLDSRGSFPGEAHQTRAPRFDRLPGPDGEVHDLREILDEIRAAAVTEPVDVYLTWTDRINKRTVGSWLETPVGHPNLIRVNRLLDDERVPRLYLASVVHHEVLHEILGFRCRGGKRFHHTREFRERERAFPGYEIAEEWARTHLARLYRSRVRSASPAKILPRGGFLSCGTRTAR